jgi:glycosyltransferase involved in cell wall biosynthesis
MPEYPYRHEVLATASRLDVNISRLNKLKALVVPNKFMGDLLVEYGVTPSLIVQSAFGIDGFIGTLAPHKGCGVLVDAFKLLQKGKAILKIYGSVTEHPDYSSKLKLLVDNKDDIEFCGTFHNSEISQVLAGVDVLVVPSLWYENTPLVVYSAQAAFCPVVASDLPGISVVIENEVNGLLFSAGDTVQLASQLSRLVDEPGLAARLSANARSPKSIASYVEELLDVWAGAVGD